MENKQAIVFAFYKNGKLIGYRQDTVGSIGLTNPKVYSEYSKNQVETVLKNVEYNVKNKEGVGAALGIDIVAEREEQVNKLLQDKKAFEIRVLKSPGYKYEKEFDVDKAEWVEHRSWDYPLEEINKWLAEPEQHEIIETHYFSMEGRINLQ